MDTVFEVLADKGDRVYALRPGASVRDAVDEMCHWHVGAILVCDDYGRPLGMFTERDLMERVVLRRCDPLATNLADVMTREVACVDGDTGVSEAMAIMTQRRCRHLPVMEDGRVIGLISIGDLVRIASRHQEYEIRLLHEYITAR
jgi:signal-transduction protein with cAMP-binding, CBS, and nucleotidyltransferase domain